MSLTYTSALCSDNRWYKNPTWRGILSTGKRFFICLDDDEPPEIVIEHDDIKIKVLDALLLAREVLNMLEIEALLNEHSFLKCGRNFGYREKKMKITQAFRFFMNIVQRPKPPTHSDTVFEGEPPDGVRYYFNSR